MKYENLGRVQLSCKITGKSTTIDAMQTQMLNLFDCKLIAFRAIKCSIIILKYSFFYAT